MEQERAYNIGRKIGKIIPPGFFLTRILVLMIGAYYCVGLLGMFLFLYIALSGAKDERISRSQDEGYC